MFTTTIEDWQDTTTHQREDWLNKYRPVIKKCITMAKRQLEKNASDMRGYFPTTAKLPILPSTKRRTRSPTSTKRTKQLDLNNNPVSNPRKTQKQKTNKKQKSKQKTTTPHDKNADITSAVTSPITQPRNDQDIRKLFPPRDKRDNHRKAHAPRQNITQRSKQP